MLSFVQGDGAALVAAAAAHQAALRRERRCAREAALAMNRAARALHELAAPTPTNSNPEPSLIQVEGPSAGQGALEDRAPGAAGAAALRAQHAALAAELKQARAAAERLRVAEAGATRALLSAFDDWCAAGILPPVARAGAGGGCCLARLVPGAHRVCF